MSAFGELEDGQPNIRGQILQRKHAPNANLLPPQDPSSYSSCVGQDAFHYVFYVCTLHNRMLLVY